MSPPGAGCASPASTLAPAKSATKADAGAAASSLGGAALQQPPAVDDRHLVAELRRVGEVVGDQQGRDGRLAQRGAELARRRGARARVERRQRLVEQQHPRRRRERARERDALALAARERARAARRPALATPKRSSSCLGARGGARARGTPRIP